MAWTDYLGSQPYVDYTIDEGEPSEVMRYLAGFGVHAQGSAGVPPAGGPVFLHGDLTRSTMLTTDTSATVVSRVAYTAFGDPVTPDGQGGWRVGWPADLGTRYQYDGGWGYESGAWGPGPDGQGAVGGPLALWGENTALPPVTLQHVGWRWYQPSLGRFVQRDPIGLRGGLNVYAYCDLEGLTCTDPSGLSGGIPIGDPSPLNPTPYPVAPGGRIRINWRPAVFPPKGPPWWKPNVPVTPGVAIQVCIAAAVGYAAGTAINNAPRLWGGRTLSERLGDIIGQGWVDFVGLGPPGWKGI